MKTLEYIKDLKQSFIRISPKQEQAIIAYFGEYIDNDFTEQDIWEQTRKVIYTTK